MEGISDIKICGIDENRPPLIRKEPYIDLFFKLVHQAPKQWCTDFNQIASKGDYTGKITPEKGLFIESWVRTPDEVETALEALKLFVETCSEEYITRINNEISAASGGSDKPDDVGEQGRLNKIVSSLKFD